MLDAAPPIPLDRSSAREATRGLPRLVRRVLGLATALEAGRLDVVLPDGRRLRARGSEPGPHAVLLVRDEAFARRIALKGDAGFAEGYVRAEWDTPDLPALLGLLAANRAALRARLPTPPFARLRAAIRARLARNTRARARRNAQGHYDLGNAFYGAWLDAGMTYSSALFGPGDSLEAAQARKMRRLADDLDLREGHRVLEIGCGWGGFAEFAAGELGCRVTGLTLSAEQLRYARARLAPLRDRARVELTDYRDAAGRYDRIASIEMFEAVGQADWALFFRLMHERLVPGGRAGLQVITIDEASAPANRLRADFIRRSIFPGGMLPTRSELLGLGAGAGFRLRSERAFGLDYARTLAEWRARFDEAAPVLAELGLDARFRRRWAYYLAYCEAGFRSGNLECRQLVFERD